jgi:phosphoglycerol transferase MdoB-like AlkP superfamily enzyme
MRGVFISKQIEILKHALRDKTCVISICVIALFLILNALKIALFNFYIIPTQTAEAFRYKFFVSIILVIIIFTLILSIKPRFVFILIYIIQAVYIMANISYFLYYHSYLNIMQFFSLFNEGFLAFKNASAPMDAKMLVALLDLPFFIYIAIKYAAIYRSIKNLYFYKLIAAAVSILFLVNIQISVYSKGNFITTLMNDRYKGESPIVQWYGTMANNITSLILMGNENKLMESLKYGEEITNEKVSGKKHNFIIIQVESLDSNMINKKYKDSYVTPYLKSLADKNIYYPYVMSYHKGGSTSDTEFSIINSVEPLDIFPAIKLSNYNYPNSMLKRLLDSSYENMVFHGNSGVFFNRDSAFPKMGFNRFYDMAKMNLKHVGWGAPDHDVFNFASDIIKKQKSPYLAYIITMTSHGPFINAKNYYENQRYLDIKDDTVRNYFNSMSYVDETIRKFIEDIQAVCKDTYIFIIGDHTPNINTELYKQASFNLEDKYFEFVPLIIITPDNKQYREEKSVASFLDICPTVLNNSGVAFNIKSNGHDLINNTGNFNKIPFKNGEFDRTYLYKEIEKVK